MAAAGEANQIATGAGARDQGHEPCVEIEQ